MTEVAKMTAAELVAAIEQKQVSAVEALEHFEQRFTEHNPTLNAIVATDFAQARARAVAADEALARGESWGPLHGLPMTLKDNIETAHLPTTFGVEGYRDYRAPCNADIAQALVDEGAIVFGKTNMPAFGTDTQTFNDLHGQTNNPWDVERTPGGSSGGAAAALAAGLTPLEIGNDIGGSIRLPAHFCGLYGHKASYGLVSGNGPKPWEGNHHHFPLTVDLASSGPLARSARDLELAMDIIAGPPANQRTAFKADLAPSRASSLAEFRVGLWLDEANYSTDTANGAVLQAAVDALSKAGAKVETIKPEVSLQRAHELRNELEAATLSYTCPQAAYESALQAAEQTATERSSRTWAQAVTMRFRDWHAINRERLVVQQQWRHYFEHVDVLLCPTARTNAHPHDHTPVAERQIDIDGTVNRYWPIIGPWNALALVGALPATIAPVGHTPDGLPVGLQIIGPYMEDRTPIRFAQLLEEQVFGRFEFPRKFQP